MFTANCTLHFPIFFRGLPDFSLHQFIYGAFLSYFSIGVNGSNMTSLIRLTGMGEGLVYRGTKKLHRICLATKTNRGFYHSFIPLVLSFALSNVFWLTLDPINPGFPLRRASSCSRSITWRMNCENKSNNCWPRITLSIWESFVRHAFRALETALAEKKSTARLLVESGDHVVAK